MCALVSNTNNRYYVIAKLGDLHCCGAPVLLGFFVCRCVGHLVLFELPTGRRKKTLPAIVFIRLLEQKYKTKKLFDPARCFFRKAANS